MVRVAPHAEGSSVVVRCMRPSGTGQYLSTILAITIERAEVGSPPPVLRPLAAPIMLRLLLVELDSVIRDLRALNIAHGHGRT